jgi:hypothetical protein
VGAAGADAVGAVAREADPPDVEAADDLAGDDVADEDVADDDVAREDGAAVVGPALVAGPEEPGAGLAQAERSATTVSTADAPSSGLPAPARRVGALTEPRVVRCESRGRPGAA